MLLLNSLADDFRFLPFFTIVVLDDNGSDADGGGGTLLLLEST